MTDEALRSIAEGFTRAAAKSARAYLDQHNLTANTDALIECLRSWVRVKLHEGWNLAVEATKAQMSAGWVNQCLSACAIEAGIEAAKEASVPVA